MDIDEFRTRWDDPEFVKSHSQVGHEPTSDIIKRMKNRDKREKRLHTIRQFSLKAPLAVLLGLAIFRIYIIDGQETLLQTIAFIIELAVFLGLHLLGKRREKCEQPKLWFDQSEFMLDEHDRMNKNIRFALWTAVLLSIAVACVGLYAVPFLSDGLKVPCLAVTAVVIIILQVYDIRRISQLKASSDDLAAQLDDLLHE